jgi:hypothetical protein
MCIALHKARHTGPWAWHHLVSGSAEALLGVGRNTGADVDHWHSVRHSLLCRRGLTRRRQPPAGTLVCIAGQVNGDWLVAAVLYIGAKWGYQAEWFMWFSQMGGRWQACCVVDEPDADVLLAGSSMAIHVLPCLLHTVQYHQPGT